MKKHIALLITLAVTVLISSMAFAQMKPRYKTWQKGPWERHESKDRMTMFLNEKVKSGVEGIRVDTIIDLPADKLFPVLTDPERAKTYSFIKEFVPLEYNEKEGYLYQRVSATGVDDRDFTVHLVLTQPETPNGGYYGWKWKQANHKGPKPKKGVVRATHAEGSYVLTPVGKNKEKTLVSYRVWFDPDSWVPDFLINRAVRNSAFETIKRIRQDAAKVKKTGSWK